MALSGLSAGSFSGFFNGVSAGGLGCGWASWPIVAPLWGFAVVNFRDHHIHVLRHRLALIDKRFALIDKDRAPVGGEEWRHDPSHRGNVPYRDPELAARYGGAAPNREILRPFRAKSAGPLPPTIGGEAWRHDLANPGGARLGGAAPGREILPAFRGNSTGSLPRIDGPATRLPAEGEQLSPLAGVDPDRRRFAPHAIELFRPRSRTANPGRPRNFRASDDGPRVDAESRRASHRPAHGRPAAGPAHGRHPAGAGAGNGRRPPDAVKPILNADRPGEADRPKAALSRGSGPASQPLVSYQMTILWAESSSTGETSLGSASNIIRTFPCGNAGRRGSLPPMTKIELKRVPDGDRDLAGSAGRNISTPRKEKIWSGRPKFPAQMLEKARTRARKLLPLGLLFLPLGLLFFPPVFRSLPLELLFLPPASHFLGFKPEKRTSQSRSPLVLQRLDDGVGHLLGVAEQHQRVVAEEELVLDPGVA